MVLLCDFNDYKVFGKIGKYKRDLRFSKFDLLIYDFEFGFGKFVE